MSKEKEAWLKNLAKNIKSLRKEKGMSQQALAEKSRLSIATIAKIEICAVENPTLDTIVSLGRALGVKDSLLLLR
ncbi:MAG: helix-turn-helix transcriptional regulator [Pseudobdellovibrionaceae bacterium]|nr:MAG: helix-turn-helix transcriptional regulator [Pseudobdellovibrionaceae bacterium]